MEQRRIQVAPHEWVRPLKGAIYSDAYLHDSCGWSTGPPGGSSCATRCMAIYRFHKNQNRTLNEYLVDHARVVAAYWAETWVAKVFQSLFKIFILIVHSFLHTARQRVFDRTRDADIIISPSIEKEFPIGSEPLLLGVRRSKVFVKAFGTQRDEP